MADPEHGAGCSVRVFLQCDGVRAGVFAVAAEYARPCYGCVSIYECVVECAGGDIDSGDEGPVADLDLGCAGDCVGCADGGLLVAVQVFE